MEHLPIFLKLKGRSAVVVGGGDLAARRVDLLCRAGARVTVVADALDEDLERMVARQHWASDIALGALLGYGIGATLWGQHSAPTSLKKRVQPKVTPKSLGIIYLF